MQQEHFSNEQLLLLLYQLVPNRKLFTHMFGLLNLI
jgi:hypothetical protein